MSEVMQRLLLTALRDEHTHDLSRMPQQQRHVTSAQRTCITAAKFTRGSWPLRITT